MSLDAPLVQVPGRPDIYRPPLLYAGMRLDRAEFYRRIERLEGEGLRTRGIERLEGVVYMPAAIRIEQHGEPQAFIVAWLALYAAATPEVQCSGNATARIDDDNDPEGDALLRIRSEFGGQSTTDLQGYIEGAPELLVEIAGSTSAQDLQLKFDIYRRSGVREYLVWETIADELYWFVLREGDYHRLQPDATGLIHSPTFPGLWLDVAALLKGELTSVLSAVQQGVLSSEHMAFRQKLAQSHSQND